MSQTELRDAVVDLWDAIPVPAPDLATVRERVTRDRRRRVARVSLVTAVCVGLTAVAGGWIGRELGTHERDDVPPFSDVEIDPALPFPMVQGNRLVLAAPNGTLVSTGVGAQEVLGQSGSEVVVYTNSSHVVSVEIAADGSVGEQKDLSGGPVGAAAISQDGSTVAYVGLDGVLTLRRVDASASTDVVFTAPVPAGSQLVDTEPDAWVVVDKDRTALSIHRVVGDVEQAVEVRVNDGVLGQAELAGDVIVVPTHDGVVHVFDARTGDHVLGHLSQPGSVSPDGRMYVTPAGRRSATPRLLETTSEDVSTVIQGLDKGAQVGRVVWQGTTRFYLATVETDRPTIWSCTVRASCSRLLDLDREAGPVELPYG